MIEVLEIKTPKVFNLNFATNGILSTFFFSLLNIDWYFLIPAVIWQSFNPITELVIPIGFPIKEVKSEIEIHSWIAEIKIRKWI